jgi:hypothetical protein
MSKDPEYQRIVVRDLERALAVQREELAWTRVILRRIIYDLPQKRDWLDPEVEKRARELLADNLTSRPTCGYCKEPMEGGPRCSHCGGL